MAVLSISSVAHAQTVQELLQKMAERTAYIETLYTPFKQEKKLTILTEPLRSEGYLCLQKKPERIVWAYTLPQESGFATVQGKKYHWNGSVQKARAAAGAEAMALKTVSEHIQAWVQVDPAQLQKLYTVQSREHEGKTFMLLTPKQKQNFFTRLEAELRPELDGVQSLTFCEKNGDSMRVHFAEPVYNAPLPSPCLILP